MRAGAPILTAAVLGLCALAEGSPRAAQALIDAGQARSAMDTLRADLVRHPTNLVARYNYAVGAYAAGTYAVAIETLTTLAGAADVEVANNSQFQLGNANFRLGEKMLELNPAGAALRFEEAIKRLDYAASQPGDYQEHSRDNARLARRKAADAFLQLAREKVSEGDRAARVNPDEALPHWESSLEHFNRAQGHMPADASIETEKRAIVARLAQEHYRSAGRLLQQGRMQAATAPERATELLRQAIDRFEKSATFGYPQADARAGAAESQAVLAETLLALAVNHRKRAEQELPRSAAVSIEALHRAEQHLEDAARMGAPPGAVAHEKALLPPLWHQSHVRRGDEQLIEAGQHDEAGKVAEQTRALIGAVHSFEDAIELQPDDTASETKRAATLRTLSEVYEGQGRQLLALAREKSDPKPEEALAAAEKSVQSFQRSISYHAENARAHQGLAEASDLLRELRGKVKEDQKKIAEKSKDDLKDTKDIKDLPKDLALRLLDYRNDKPAARNPQLLTAPENKPLQDW